MRLALASALALSLALALPTVAAGSLSFTLVAHDDGFTLAGAAVRNPTLHVPPGSNVTITFQNDASTAQDLLVGDPVGQRTPCCQRPGESAVLSFAVGADAAGQIPYWSEQAPDALRGVIQVGDVPPTIALATPRDQSSVGASVTARAAVSGVDAPRVAWALDGANVTNATGELTHTFDVTEGHHLIHVELLDANGTYRSPRIFAEAVVFRGRDPLTTTDETPASTTPASPSKTPGVGLVALLGVVALSASLCRRRR